MFEQYHGEFEVPPPFRKDEKERMIEYFRRYRESHTKSEEAPQAAEVLLRPVAFGEEYKKEGAIRVEREHIVIAISYTDISDEEAALLQRVFKESARQDWRKLEAMTLHDTEKNQHIDFFDIFEDTPTVFFKINNESTHTRVFYEAGVIALASNPTRPISILTLFHEVGHLAREKTRAQNPQEVIAHRQAIRMVHEGVYPKGKFTDTDKENAAGIVLADERDAWAFALKKLKPFLGSALFPKNDVLNLVHGYFLTNYTRGLEQRIQQKSVARLIEKAFTAVKKFFNG